jgi:hypothetical protein
LASARPFEIEYDAHISWEDSGTGIYDSDEGRMMFMEERTTTVHKTHEASVDVHLTFDVLAPKVDEIDLVHPTNSIGIRIPASYGGGDQLVRPHPNVLLARRVWVIPMVERLNSGLPMPSVLCTRYRIWPRGNRPAGFRR